MFLKSLDMQGFKSFADRTHLNFSEGITALLGPNGCGKSNFVDAVKWVLGEQSTKTLRAKRMEDVIFHGTDTRKPLPYCEVALTFDNSTHALPVDTAEVEIKRRIFRNGTNNEYYINRQLSTLREVRALFFDTGVGKSAYSILEQGKIDQILLQTPQDRRIIFEEAAGISRFKAESVEAERKLLKAEENVAQVEGILTQTKRIYDSKKSQARKAIRYRELKEQRFALEVDVQLTSIKSFMMMKDEFLKKRKESQSRYDESKKRHTEGARELEQLRDEFKGHGQNRIDISLKLSELNTRCKGRDGKLQLLDQRFREMCIERETFDRRATQMAERLEDAQNSIAEHQQVLFDLEQRISTLNRRIGEAASQLETAQNRAEDTRREAGLKRAEALNLEKEILETRKEVDSLTLSIIEQIDEKINLSGYSPERKAEAKEEFLSLLGSMRETLSRRLEFLSGLSSVSVDGRKLLDTELEFQKSISEDFSLLESRFNLYIESQPSFIDDLMAPTGIVAKKKDGDSRLGQMNSTLTAVRERIGALEQLSVELSEHISTLGETVNTYRMQLSGFDQEKRLAEARIADFQTRYQEQEDQYQEFLSDRDNLDARMYDTQQSIRAEQDALHDDKQQIETLQSNLAFESDEVERIGVKIQSCQQQQETLFSSLQGYLTEISNLKIKAEGLDEQISGVYTNFFETWGKSLKEYDSRLSDDIEEYRILKNRLDSVKKEINGLGSINQMAEDEFNEVKGQYEFLSEQLSDLNKAREDLQGVLEDIKTRSSELFLSTYKAISENFQDLYRKLFGGGRAELKLTDPENVLESGIEIFAQPPGKKLATLSLLSGGERSMTAVALLFATYKVKPSPFCILDEIDAALDDKNIGNFLSVLSAFAQESQFIIITHNKHTVLGASSMLGVTQVEPGVSITVSYRLSKVEGKPVIMDDRNQQVTFDDSGRRLQ